MKKIDNELVKLNKERRQREDKAKRLNRVVPKLKVLSLKIEEIAVGREDPPITHTRHIVVENAPAHFEIPCVDRLCRHGGHDLTRSILPKLRNGQTDFEGIHRCKGEVRGKSCILELRFKAEASYA